MSVQTKVRSERLARLLEEIKPVPGFSCLEMKRQGQERIMQELHGKTEAEIQAYWDQAHEALLAWQAAARAKPIEDDSNS